MNSKEYWEVREREALKHYIRDEKEYTKELHSIYANMLDACQNEINAFYGRFASKEGVSIAEAKKRVSKADIEAYERKAKQYVKTKDFSDKANEEMRLYNTMMKINRLEMLKANIGLEMIAGHDELEKFMAKILKGRTMDELKRQAGILGKTIQDNAKTANAIVNGSFHSGTFSDRIWQYQDLMREELGRLLQVGLIQGKNPRAIAKDLRKYWYGNDPKTGGGAEYCMERLMRTELARVQTEAQKQSFERNGFSMYTFHVNTGCCDVCRALDGKHFKVKDMMPGENASPMHPNCRCSCSAYEDSEEYEAWLDYLANGGTTEDWNKLKKSGKSLEKFFGSGKIKAKIGSTIAMAKRLLDVKERSRVINEAIGAEKAVYADDLRIAYKNVKPKDGCMDVCLHGASEYTEYEHKYILDSETLSYIISGRRDYQGKNVRLLSCSTGKADKNGKCVAQELADLLGVDVYAPIDVLNIGLNGDLTVGTRPRLSEKDGFKWFHPREGSE